MEYESQAHAKYLLLDHLILVGKYRKKLLLSYGEEVKRIFEKIAARSDFSFEATFSVPGSYSLPDQKWALPLTSGDCTRGAKQESTFRLWKRHEPELQRQFWKERTFWSDGYFCCTIGNASQATIRQYIEQQQGGRRAIHPLS